MMVVILMARCCFCSGGDVIGIWKYNNNHLISCYLFFTPGPTWEAGPLGSWLSTDGQGFTPRLSLSWDNSTSGASLCTSGM